MTSSDTSEATTPEPNVLVLDLAGVVFRFEHPHRLQVIAEASGLSPEEVHERFWGSGFSARCDAGDFTLAEARAYLREHLPWEGSDEDLDSLWCSAYWPDDDVVAIVASSGLALAGFTNSGPIEDEWMRAHYPDIFALLGTTWFAHTLHVNKPAPAAYEAVAEGLSRSAAQIAFIDDSQKNVDGAHAVGWQADLYTGPESLKDSLRKWFGLEQS